MAKSAAAPNGIDRPDEEPGSGKVEVRIERDENSDNSVTGRAIVTDTRSDEGGTKYIVLTCLKCGESLIPLK